MAFMNLDGQLTKVLGDIFAECTKDIHGKVEVSKLIEVLAKSHGISDEIGECLRIKLDPDRTNPLISRDILQSIVKDVLLNSWEGKTTSVPVAHPSSDSPYDNQITYTSTPIQVSWSGASRRLDLKDEIPVSPIFLENFLPTTRSPRKADGTRVSVCRLKNLNEELEALATSFEMQLNKEHGENIKLKKEIEQLRDENRKLNRTIEAKQQEEIVKCHDLERLNKFTMNNNEKILKRINELEQHNLDLISEKDCLLEKIKEKTKVINEQKVYITRLDQKCLNMEKELSITSTDLKQELLKSKEKVQRLEEDRNVLLERIVQLSTAKQEIQIELAELSACAVDNCMRNTENNSSEAITSMSEINETTLHGVSLMEELEHIKVSLASPPSDNSSSPSKCLSNLVNIETQTDFVQGTSDVEIQTEIILRLQENKVGPLVNKSADSGLCFYKERYTCKPNKSNRTRTQRVILTTTIILVLLMLALLFNEFAWVKRSSIGCSYFCRISNWAQMKMMYERPPPI